MLESVPRGSWNALLERYGLSEEVPASMAPAVARLEAYLAFCAIEDSEPEKVLEGLVGIARENGLSVARVMVAWRMLDTRFATKQLIWREGRGIEVSLYSRQDAMNSDAYLRSPLRAVVEDQSRQVLRRRICEPAERTGYPALDDYAADGLTDYIIYKVQFGENAVVVVPGAGVVISFASDRPGGFMDDEYEALARLRYMLALAVRNTMQTEMRESVTRTYLARSASDLMRTGDMLRGSGSTVDSVIWYCDLRGSTALCEGLGLDRYLPLLNAYFAATAGEVVAHGGDVLDFIGDAVLAAWPRSTEGVAAALAATRAAIAALAAFREQHGDMLAGRADVASVAGIAIDVGPVMSGNIGITERLTFSVIGSTVNQVARIERMTKTLREPVLVTAEVAAAEPGDWVSRGAFPLEGVAQPKELFALNDVTAIGAA